MESENMRLMASTLDPEMYGEAAISKAAEDVRAIIDRMGFGDEVLDSLIKMLIDAWLDGGKWHTKLMIAVMHGSGPDEAMAMGAEVLGYKKKEADGG